MVPPTLLAVISSLAMAVNLGALDQEKRLQMWLQHAKAAEVLLAPDRDQAEPAPALLINAEV